MAQLAPAWKQLLEENHVDEKLVALLGQSGFVSASVFANTIADEAKAKKFLNSMVRKNLAPNVQDDDWEFSPIQGHFITAWNLAKSASERQLQQTAPHNAPHPAGGLTTNSTVRASKLTKGEKQAMMTKFKSS